MQKHDGQIIELAVRKKSFSITELARHSHVNRSMVYQWFGKKDLDPEVIHRIGQALDHDFSSEFPEHFEEKNNNGIYKLQTEDLSEDEGQTELWKDKYLALLEKYVELLAEITDR